MFYIFLPAYNEEDNIKVVLDNLYKLYKRKFKGKKVFIVIVNDGSSDNTGKVIDKYVRFLKNKKNFFKIKKITHKSNKGLGQTIKSGFKYVLKRSKKEDILISLDCDNTHPVNLISLMVKKIKYGNDLVIASRFVKNSKVVGVPISRQILSYAASIIFRLFFPIKNVKDYTSGYRAYRIKILKKTIKNMNYFFSEKGFSVMADILLKLKIFNKSINAEEVPMILRYDLKKGKSKMAVTRNIFYSLVLIFNRKFF